jgi:adenylate cyclase
VELLQQLKGELSKFVPDAVKALLERDPNATELEKRTEEVSVLFLDIAGYTKLSEQLPPEQLNQLVQTYFSSFLEVIRAHHGDVNETAGDGLMVIFQRADQDKADRVAKIMP